MVNEFAYFLNGQYIAKEDIPTDTVIIVSCGCHNGHGITWRRDGHVKETTVRERCAKHAAEGHPFLDTF